MKVVLQRVSSASVEVDGGTVGSIGRGYLVFLGIGESDDRTIVEKMVDKISRLRIFPDANGKTNLSAKEVDGAILVVSQFTLMADCSQNRPSFCKAAKPDIARQLYEYFVEQAKTRFTVVASGVFAADMKVSLINDGPFTLVMEL